MQKKIKDNKLKETQTNIDVLGEATKNIETLKNSLQLEEDKTIQLKANLKSEQDKCRGEQSKCKNLKSDFDQLKKLTDEVKQERDKFKSRLEDLRSYRDKYDSIKKKKADCDTQIEEQFSKERSDFSSQLKKTQKLLSQR